MPREGDGTGCLNEGKNLWLVAVQLFKALLKSVGCSAAIGRSCNNVGNNPVRLHRSIRNFYDRSKRGKVIFVPADRRNSAEGAFYNFCE